MKKVFKRLALALLALLLIVLISVGIAVWVVFTPERLTPIVRNQALKYLTCKTDIGAVELTFFSTFPQFGLKVSNLNLVNPVTGAQSDTLFNANEIVGIIDIVALYKRNELVVNEVSVANGSINAYIDTLGASNFSIAVPDTAAVEEPADTSGMPFSFIDIERVSLQDVDVSFVDKSQAMQAGVKGLTTTISGSLAADDLKAHLKVDKANVFFALGKDVFAKDLNVSMDVPAEVNLSTQLVKLTNAELAANGMAVTLSGTVQNDTIGKRIVTDIRYDLANWSIADVMALIPASVQGYVKGIDVTGIVASSGTVKGAYSQTEMPFMDIRLQMQDGTLKYYEAFPLPLSNINGDISLSTDLKDDAASILRIASFSASTPRSSFQTSGTVNHLFSDISIDLTSTANVTVSEFKSYILKDMNVTATGNVSGTVKSKLTLSQIEKMQLDKMRLSGSLTLNNFSATYDSLAVKTSQSKVNFVLPNPNASLKGAGFAAVTINTKGLEASKIDDFTARLLNTLVSVEVSNVTDESQKSGGVVWAKLNAGEIEATQKSNARVFLKNASLSLNATGFADSTRIPSVSCTFSLDTLFARMDTLDVAIANPAGTLSIAAQKDSPKQPELSVDYTSGKLFSNIGSATAGITRLALKADVINDSSQQDIFLQWMAKGFIDMEQGRITTSSILYPIEIPSIKMDFDPENFNIKESKLRIDRSDFSLKGSLNNVLSYFRHDSLLRGSFLFESTKTDLVQLMVLTSGIGETEAESADTVLSGPYMVPKGIDLLLQANIAEATFGDETASNIKGELRVKDGLMVLDGFRFTTPAARMQLTAMYRTPRKNHLFLGLNYHMLDIEIERLLQMIPQVDSMMPMLRSFKGKGEFHIAVETYTDSLYNPKKSTLRGASSIKGNNLVLMDGETFTEIAKTLRFDKKTENRVDSLSAEFTIFKQEIDIYPFLIVMDKYKAVVEGRHNLDMSFNYHISLIDSPLPIKLGVDISGTMNNLKFRPAKCKYANMYRPASRRAVESRQLELRRIIREALLSNIRED
ncbi:MAG: hypothetical protein JW783_13860 [Bacteroidales bacterium]|nr:hypothetical protein [Bacteroidales bacterium]MBN2750419.1 hypothetical protein [Bacteroidales bacterium]